MLVQWWVGAQHKVVHHFGLWLGHRDRRKRDGRLSDADALRSSSTKRAGGSQSSTRVVEHDAAGVLLQPRASSHEDQGVSSLHHRVLNTDGRYFVHWILCGDGGSRRQAARAAASSAPGARVRVGPQCRIVRNRHLDAPDRRARFERLQSSIADKLERECVRDEIVDEDATEDNEVLCVDSFRTGEMVPVRFLPQGQRSYPGY